MNALSPANARSAASPSVRAAVLSGEALASLHEHLDAWVAYEAPEEDPLPDMIEEYGRVTAAYCLLHDDDAQKGAMFEAYNTLEGRICTTRAVTPAGLLAQAIFVRDRYAEAFGRDVDGTDKRRDHERGVDTLAEGIRDLFCGPVKIAGHLADQGHDPLPGLVAEWRRRRALEQDAETDDDVETAVDFTFEMDRPICFAKPRCLAGLKAQAVFLRHELRA